jgi:Ser/Thr protein kinase RdoA (MazF antagonist)
MTGMDAARRVLADLYGIDARLSRLYGEFDDNFLAVAPNGDKRILKIMHVGCALDRVDMQCQALAHLAETAVALDLPRVLPTPDGHPYALAPVGGKERIVWLLDYCEATLLESVSPRTDDLHRSFGRTVALLDVGLESFTHPAMKAGHEWQLSRAGEARAHVRHVTSDIRSLVDDVLGRFEHNTLDMLERLPHSVIHNDANPGNVLVDSKDGAGLTVVGLIDFGDMGYQATVCDAAIALAYVAVGMDDPITACIKFLEGYNEINPLQEDEVSVLFDSMMTRLAVSIAIAAGRLSRNPDDPVGSQDTRPSMYALERLAGLSGPQVEQRFRVACRLDAG